MGSSYNSRNKLTLASNFSTYNSMKLTALVQKLLVQRDKHKDSHSSLLPFV